MPQLQFYLDEDYIKKLAALQEEEDKSLQLAAKRLLISLLDDLLPDSNPKDIEEIKRRLDLLENRPQAEVDSPPIADLEAIKERLAALERELGSSFIAYKEQRDRLDIFELKMQGYEAITNKCLELFKNQEARLKALEEAPGRSQKKRDANGRFLKKGETDE